MCWGGGGGLGVSRSPPPGLPVLSGGLSLPGWLCGDQGSVMGEAWAPSSRAPFRIQSVKGPSSLNNNKQHLAAFFLFMCLF